MPYRYIVDKVKNFVVHKILRLDDTPHRIALGVAIGIFVTWTPTIGAQMVLVVALCTLFRANKVVGVPLVWLSNPFTLVPVYGPNYWAGVQVMKLFGREYTWQAFWNAFKTALQSTPTWYEKVQHWWGALDPILVPLWVGSVLVGAVLGIIAYVATYYGVIGYRALHGHASTPEMKK
ncbi:MAG: DUF2062 domain-containing protein [Planctomycetaceae bacterium]|nr:DUF2062 domain-containing protein [Planctomycetaceae bacterium]